jgi:hypothetical protein
MLNCNGAISMDCCYGEGILKWYKLLFNIRLAEVNSCETRFLFSLMFFSNLGSSILTESFPVCEVDGVNYHVSAKDKLTWVSR